MQKEVEYNDEWIYIKVSVLNKRECGNLKKGGKTKRTAGSTLTEELWRTKRKTTVGIV